MNLNDYEIFFELSQNYTIDDIKKSYNILLLKYHKQNNKDIHYYNKLNNYYSNFIVFIKIIIIIV